MHSLIEPSQVLRRGASYLLLLIKAYILSYLFTHLFFMPVYVQGQSMEPIIKEGTIGFSNIAGRYVFGIHRFDIVLIQRESGEIWVKRVMSLSWVTIDQIPMIPALWVVYPMRIS